MSKVLEKFLHGELRVQYCKNHSSGRMRGDFYRNVMNELIEYPVRKRVKMTSLWGDTLLKVLF